MWSTSVSDKVSTSEYYVQLLRERDAEGALSVAIDDVIKLRMEKAALLDVVATEQDVVDIRETAELLREKFGAAVIDPPLGHGVSVDFWMKRAGRLRRLAERISRSRSPSPPKCDCAKHENQVCDICQAAAHGSINSPDSPTERKYNELIYAVATKYPGESRHETALRYIRQQEEGFGASGSAAADGCVRATARGQGR